MTTSPELDDIFAREDARATLQRDQYDRPLLVPGSERATNPYLLNRRTKANPDGRRPDGKLPYTRASSLANYVADHTGLHTWQMRSLTKGLGDREDLAAQAASLPPIIGNRKAKQLMTAVEVEQDRLTNAMLDVIADEAMAYANDRYKANWGTAMHSFTDRVIEGEQPAVPERMKSDVEAFADLTRGWEFVATEVFVRNDIYQAAGTFDHLCRIPWRPDLGTFIVDKKTGLEHDDQVSIQLAVYAGGEPYDVDTDTTYEWPGGDQPNPLKAVRVDIPMGLGVATFTEVDIRQGAKAAHVACEVRTHRSNKTLAEKVDIVAQRDQYLFELIAQVDSRQTMLALSAEWGWCWDDRCDEAARARLETLRSR